MLINAQVVRFVNSDQTIFASDVNQNLDILKSYNFPLINYWEGLTQSEIEQLVCQPFGESKACYNHSATKPPNFRVINTNNKMSVEGGWSKLTTLKNRSMSDSILKFFLCHAYFSSIRTDKNTSLSMVVDRPKVYWVKYLLLLYQFCQKNCCVDKSINRMFFSNSTFVFIWTETFKMKVIYI